MKQKEGRRGHPSRDLQFLIFQAKKELEEIFDSVHDSITVHDNNFNIIRANKAAEALLGLPIKKMLRQKCFRVYHGAVCPPENCPCCQALKAGTTTTTDLFEPKLIKHLQVTAIPRFDKNNKVIGVIHIVRDITQQKNVEDRLLFMSLRDELTGLYNRRGYSIVASQYLKILNRQNEGAFVMYADLDNLKLINDNYGHNEGDIVLRETANILKVTFRESDIIARIGGDEFAVIPIGTQSDTAGKILSRLHKAIENFNAKRKLPYRVSLSTGIAYYDPEHPCSVKELLNKADKLMYEQKRQKKT
jgi:diguanylate cyclase (GGDEF)-like protein